VIQKTKEIPGRPGSFSIKIKTKKITITETRSENIPPVFYIDFNSD